jgi:monothiol glutaredoxin
VSDTAETDVIHDFIAKAIEDHPVVLFMKGVPDEPRCGFSAICVQILDHLGVDFVRASSSAARTSCARCSSRAS